MNWDRILLSLFWIPILAASFVMGTELHLFVLLVAVTGLSLLEFLGMCRFHGIFPPGFITMGGGLAVLSAASWVGATSGLAVTMLVILCAFAAFPMSGRAEGTLSGASSTALAMIWIPLPLAHMMYLRCLPGGNWILLLVMSIIWFSDSGAYFTGKLSGKRKLSPYISPSKTVEGTLGGLLAGLIASLVMGHLLGDLMPLSVWPLIVLGLTIPTVGLFGDLAESAFKRDVGTKDSGTLMGSHGGILDRFDSSLFAAPAAWYILQLLNELGVGIWK